MRNARYLFFDSGWRRAMEDAAISELDIGNGNSIFGVFDGHGGTVGVMKVLRYQNMLKRSLFLNSKTINCTNSRNIRRPWWKHSKR